MAALLCAPAHARQPLIPYLEAGVGVVTGGCLYRWGDVDEGRRVRVECSRSPVTVFAAGLRVGDTGLRLQFEHWSAPLDTRDRGIEMFTLRYRYEFR